MSIDRWEPYFKPEVRNAGRTLVGKGVVALSRGSDTETQCYIRGTSSFRVNFRSPAIDDPKITATCTCPQSKKSFCKHMWAAFIEIDEKTPDFLEDKTELLSADEAGESDTAAVAKKPMSESQLAYQAKREEVQAAQKERQAVYRKQSYQKQKDRLNEKKGISKKGASSRHSSPAFSDDVEEALKYFSENGFELKETMTSEAIASARKILARVFHPDKGGSHDEILELNKNADLLLDFADR